MNLQKALEINWFSARQGEKECMCTHMCVCVCIMSFYYSIHPLNPAFLCLNVFTGTKIILQIVFLNSSYEFEKLHLSPAISESLSGMFSLQSYFVRTLNLKVRESMKR